MNTLSLGYVKQKLKTDMYDCFISFSLTEINREHHYYKYKASVIAICQFNLEDFHIVENEYECILMDIILDDELELFLSLFQKQANERFDSDDFDSSSYEVDNLIYEMFNNIYP